MMVKRQLVDADDVNLSDDHSKYIIRIHIHIHVLSSAVCNVSIFIHDYFLGLKSYLLG